MLIYLTLAFCGFLVVAGAFLFGHDHDHDIGHEHDVGHDGDGHDHAISIFSTRIIATFVMGFGAAGAIARLYGHDHMMSSLFGMGAGVGLGYLMFLLMNFFVQQQGSSVTREDDLIGERGIVTVPIDENSPGEIGIQTSAGYRNFVARASTPIKKGRSVRVADTSPGVLLVEEEV